ncbi:MAG TPA: urease accessory protein UreD, partial [Candidatus Dormibacteraeota bacterium]|nr:urease accessory protein UreD [Candidatus Dormibacteraeota bacterium]
MRICTVRFGARDGVTRLLVTSAAGPLRVVRAEAGPVCDAVVVQTRGGLCAGDRWLLDVEVTDGARVRLRAAGATILHSGPAGCRTRLRVTGGARLSYRARGVIAMPGATGVAVTVVEAEPGCRVAVSEILAPVAGWVLRSRLLVR